MSLEDDLGHPRPPRRQTIEIRHPEKPQQASHKNPNTRRRDQQQPKRQGTNVKRNAALNVALSDQLEKQWPLEANPIQQAVLAYGRRTAALGALQGAHALKNLVARIRGLGNVSPALDQIVNDAEADANRLRLMLDKVYEDD